ncbi:unnamed protein product, partial [Sphacelaria rigidula]
QSGTEEDDFARISVATPDGGIVLAGHSLGDWDGDNAGGDGDFIAVKINTDGKELWRWQVCARAEEMMKSVLVCVLTSPQR